MKELEQLALVDSIAEEEEVVGNIELDVIDMVAKRPFRVRYLLYLARNMNVVEENMVQLGHLCMARRTIIRCKSASI